MRTTGTGKDKYKNDDYTMKKETKDLLERLNSGRFTKSDLIDILIRLITKQELLENKVDNLDTVCEYLIKDLNLNKYPLI